MVTIYNNDITKGLQAHLNQHIQDVAKEIIAEAEPEIRAKIIERLTDSCGRVASEMFRVVEPQFLNNKIVINIDYSPIYKA